MLSEFKKFIIRGNALDLAVGVIIGAAFTSIVNSVVSDLLTPLISRITGGLDFLSSLFIALDGNAYPSLSAVPERVAVLRLGSFLHAVINFLITSICLFLIVKGINKLRAPFGKRPEPSKPQRQCPYCLREVADAATRCPHCTSALETYHEIFVDEKKVKCDHRRK